MLKKLPRQALLISALSTAFIAPARSQDSGVTTLTSTLHSVNETATPATIANTKKVTSEKRASSWTPVRNGTPEEAKPTIPATPSKPETPFLLPDNTNKKVVPASTPKTDRLLSQERRVIKAGARSGSYWMNNSTQAGESDCQQLMEFNELAIHYHSIAAFRPAAPELTTGVLKNRMQKNRRWNENHKGEEDNVEPKSRLHTKTKTPNTMSSEKKLQNSALGFSAGRNMNVGLGDKRGR